MISQIYQRDIFIVETLLVALQSFCLDNRQQRLAAWMLGDQGAGGDVVDTRRDRDVDAQRGALGFVLLAGAALGGRAGADELEVSVLDSLDKLVVFGHESVTGEDRVVAVVMGYLDDLADPLDALFLGGPGVIWHAVHTAVVGQHAQLRGKRIRIDDRILFGEQDAVMADAHLFVNLHRLEADRAATDDQRLEVFAREGTDPLGVGLAQAAIAMDQWIVRVIVILCHWLSPNRNLDSLNDQLNSLC